MTATQVPWKTLPEDLDEPDNDDNDGWKFGLNDPVEITVSGEQGTVQARAEYIYSPDRYLIRYADGNGSAREEWWDEDALERLEVQ